MMTIFWIGMACLGMCLVVFLGWRLSSRRRSLPCPTWLGWLVEINNPFFKVNRADTIVRGLDLWTGMKVLDYGCGPGRVTIPLAKAIGPKGEVVAVALQPGMLARVQAKAQSAGLSNIRLLPAASGAGKLGSNQFERALLVTVLGEIPDRIGTLQEIFGALKPGGLLSVTEIIADPHYQRRRSVLRWAQAAGFREKAYFGNWMAFTVHLEKPEVR